MDSASASIAISICSTALPFKSSTEAVWKVSTMYVRQEPGSDSQIVCFIQLYSAG
jgi:uncharacterized protein YgiM (DUF1202 family)